MSANRFKRSTAYKLDIKDIIESNFFQEDMQDKKISYAITPFGLKLQRVRILGDVSFIRNRENESTGDVKSIFFVVNDGTEDIGVNVFLESQFNTRYVESTKNAKDLKVGDSVEVIGRVRKRENIFSIMPEIITRIEDPNLETLRVLEKIHLKVLIKKNKLFQDDKSHEKENAGSQHEDEDYESNYEEPNTTEFGDEITEILSVMTELDEEDGVTIEKISKHTNIDMNRLKRIIRELFEDGTIYEPREGKFKKL